VSVAIENVRDPTVTLWTHSVEDVTVILTVETQCAIGFTTDLRAKPACRRRIEITSKNTAVVVPNKTDKEAL
jgi:hypothetical protein